MRNSTKKFITAGALFLTASGIGHFLGTEENKKLRLFESVAMAFCMVESADCIKKGMISRRFSQD
jgi:hypothetical protein